VLYWFRTPPGVKVGRAALDEDAIRLIEQLNPGIEFDWTRILKGQGTPATESRPPVDIRRQRPDNRRPQSPHAPPAPRAAQPIVPAEPAERQAPEHSPVAAAPEPVGQAADAAPAPASPAESPATIESDVPTPAHARLGAEGVQRLRARHAEILVRISERAADPARREELKTQADRLNPDAWVTDDEVVQGLEQYESVFASLREVVGQKRRRRRRGRGPRPPQPGGAVSANSDSSAGASGGDSFDSAEGPGSPDSNHSAEDDDGDVTPDET
jgi:hypothetical protein